MSGHSKWANIKHRKAKIDEKRGKAFTKLGRELIMAAKSGGGDPNSNFRLKMAIQKAREANMPMDNIQRLVQRAKGEAGAENYDETVYEGYGPGGTAILLKITTDNRNRTASEIRYLFSRNGGSLGESGCVAWMFDAKGIITIGLAETREHQDAIVMMAIEAGAEDVEASEEQVEVITLPEELETVRGALIQNGLKPDQAEVTMMPKNTIAITDEQVARQVLRLVDLLEDHDDVQAVYANFDIPDEIMSRIED